MNIIEILTEAPVSKEVAVKMAEDLMKDLAKYSKKLPDVYDNTEDYLYDMYPDLPWDDAGLMHALQHMVNSPKMKEISAEWQKNHKFDMMDELRDALQELIDEMK